MKTHRLFNSGIVLILTIGLLYNCSNPKIANKEGNKSLLFYSNNDVYQNEWKKVDSLEAIGLTKSALNEVNKIRQKSTEENNYQQQLKSLIVKAKLQSRVEENAFENTLQELTLEAQQSNYPLTPLLHSIIAEMYWQYYQKNRWRFQNRSTTPNFKNDDITTWSLAKIIDVTTQHYLLSIKNMDSLQRTPIKNFNQIILENNARKYRPFLYDFLAHRAIDFFMNEEADIINSAVQFTIDSNIYLASAKSFAEIKINSPQHRSSKYYALTTLQNLTQIHLHDSTPTALIDVELKRLKFVVNNATFPNADSLYYYSLKKLHQQYKESSSEGEISYQLANIHYANGKKYDPLKSPKYQWDLKTAYDLCINSIKKHPNSFGAEQCSHLQSLIEQKDLSVLMEKVNIPSSPLKAKIISKNINNVFFRLYEVSYEWYSKINNYNTQEKFLSEINSMDFIRKWELDLQNEGDFQSHSGEIKIDPLAVGFYVLLTSNTTNFTYQKEAVAITPFWVSNLGYLSRKKDENTDEFIVVNRESGLPIQGVKAELFSRKYNYESKKYEEKLLTTKTTNANGSFLIQAEDEYKNYTVNFSYKNDQLNTNDNFYQYKSFIDENKKHTKTLFFTDRAIYRPGQIVYFKGVVLETDNKNNNRIQANFKSTVTFYDVNYQKITSTELTTNEYGTFSGSFTAPNNGLNGQMHISNTYGSIYIAVEEYKRPKFEVSFQPVRGSYRLEKNVDIVGAAKTYSGATLDEATVNYRVVRNANFPYSCYYRWGYWPPSNEVEIKNGTTTTNDNGQFNIDFIAKSDKTITKDFSPTYSYTVYADVVDINGETHSSSTVINVSYQALKINLNFPEKLNKNGVDTFDLSTTNLNGEHQSAQGNIKIWALKIPQQYYRSSLLGKVDKKYITKEDYLTDFPLDEYDDENNLYKWEKERLVYDDHFNTANKNSFQLAQLSKWKSGVYILEIITKDKFGEEIKEIKYFTVFSEEEKYIPSNDLAWFNEIKTNGEPGEEAIFLIGSAAKNVHLLYEIEHKGKITHQEKITLKEREQRKIIVPIKENHRGNFQVHISFVKHGRSHSFSSTVTVPYTNKELDIQFETFRNKLYPGQKEQWKIKVKGKRGEKVAAEMAATLYDASLDAFRSNSWGINILPYYQNNMYWKRNTSFGTINSQLFAKDWNTYTPFPQKHYDDLNWFGYNGYRSGIELYGMPMAKSMGALEVVDSDSDLEEVSEMTVQSSPQRGSDKMKETSTPINKIENQQNFETLKARKNFNETAFFYPHLTTNEAGEIIINFTIPEALTKWKFMGLAHTKDLKTGMIFNETLTQKDLMVYPNAPRFFRESDQLDFSTKIVNLSDKNLNGDAKIFFYDAITMAPIDEQLLNSSSINSFHIEKGKSTSITWQIRIPEGYSAITYKVIATSGDFSDGEEMTIPVLTNRMLVTESMPLPIRGKQTKTYQFEKLINNKSTTLKHHQLTLEYTSNPAWYAIQALPYLMEYPYDCAEQTFSRFYANAIASHIANSNPKIKAVFESWKNSSPETFLSNLEKNQELKAVLLKETPWVLNAQNESERKKRIALLFDLNKMDNELQKAEKKLQELQVSSGAWAWFKGMPENRYITQHIVTGMGHLDHLGIQKIRANNDTWNMVKKAITYLDNSIRTDYDRLKKHNSNIDLDLIDYHQIQYLYARSYFLDLPIDAKNQKAYNYYKSQSQKYWVNKSVYMQGMIALFLHRTKDSPATQQKIMASLKENAIHHEELGMYWKNNQGGYQWYQAPIETQALLIEAFDEVINDQESVGAMKVWLLKQKQTQDWRTTKATTEACYALLLKGTDLLASDQLVEIKVGNQVIDPKKIEDVKVEAGTGYFKTSWNKTAIQPNMGNITVTKKEEGVAWGAMYWQYFEQLDKITPHETPLKLVKTLFVEKHTPTGPVITPIIEETKLKHGDKIKVRIELRVDRDMEYVHMKDMRAAGLEPINVFSGHRYQDGLGYYQSTKDASTDFFFDYLRKGTYVFEYPLRVNMSGNFSNGISSIQCMYAPEFTAHSKGIRLTIKK
ncbi:MAG: alpha-2-macroglobulin [Vicingus serpentipes]|nr:alpha-2-macroglobulin [Vicingus serpentipes]